MMAAIKAELRKLLTVRSTYVLLLFAFLLEALFAFYATGIRAQPETLQGSAMLTGQVTAAVGLVSTLIAFVAVLLVTHEYRYNTILYTVTASPSRSRVFLAKVVVVTLFSVVATLIFAALAPLMTIAGVQLSGHTLGPQTIPYASLIARAAFVGWAFSMLALSLAFIIRSQIGAIAAIFLIPSTVEELLGLLLKYNQVYLPYSSLNAVLEQTSISHGRATLVASGYLIIGWLVAWLLFLRRDAAT